MWLLNIRSYKLEQFEGSETPPYAILSHRWETEEVTFDDIYNKPERLKGWQKIWHCCQQTLKYSLGLADVEPYDPDLINHVWIDTCCIDKRSSAELSEAINSMYAWYRGAAICLVYLSDISQASEFSSSLWFARGWTLQELLAPQDIVFFDLNWNRIGRKAELVPEINRTTRIPIKALLDFNPRDFSVAERMSWAADRETRRIEDRAYSLLGLFEISMPMLYGEGNRAFQRLQEEILRCYDDMSILLWDDRSSNDPGMLATSPSDFTAVGNYPNLDAFMLNNAGLYMEVYVVQYASNVRAIFPYDVMKLWRNVLYTPPRWDTEIGRNVPVIFGENLHYSRYKRTRVNNRSWCKVSDLDWNGFPNYFPIDFWPPRSEKITLLRSQTLDNPELPLRYFLRTTMEGVDLYFPERVYTGESSPARTSPYKIATAFLTDAGSKNTSASKRPDKNTANQVDCGLCACLRIDGHTDIILSCDYLYKPLLIVQSRDKPDGDGKVLLDEPINTILDRFENFAIQESKREQVRLSSETPHYELFRGAFEIQAGRVLCNITTAHIKLELRSTEEGFIVTLEAADPSGDLAVSTERVS